MGGSCASLIYFQEVYLIIVKLEIEPPNPPHKKKEGKIRNRA